MTYSFMLRLIMHTIFLFLVLLVAVSLFATVIHSSGDCSEDQRKCDDGSCISMDENWNDNVICQNSSVPSHILRRKARQTGKDNMCVLPGYPANGKYTTHIPNAKPGDSYEVVTTKFTCDRGFALVGFASIYCVKGEWSEPMPKCASQCHLPPHDSVEYRCLLETGEGSRPCKAYEVNGTVVSPQCRRPNYYSATVLTYMQCVEGNWNYIAAFQCIPECGTASSTGTNLIIGGEPAKSAEVPWHAAIYSKTTDPYTQICGGSLISNNVVISAAHCFWSHIESKQLPAAGFAVAVGKLYRPWNNDKEDAQKSDVLALHLPPHFQGSVANFQEDIAVVVVKMPFKYTTFIRPVCIDFDNFFQESQLKVGNMGKVAGWGLTDVNGTASQVLQVISLPYVSTGTCIDESPPSFRGYITGDKLCAGFKNENKAVCKGDSGGGLAFPESERGTPHYYLRGVASTAPNNEDMCNSNFYTAFTQIQKHEHFIKKYWKSGEMPCKEVTIVKNMDYTPYSMEDGELNHVTLKRNSSGHLTYFHMLFFVKADDRVTVKLADKGNYWISNILYNIDLGWDISNQYTRLALLLNDTWTTVQVIRTPDIISATQFRAYYIKIDNGKLEFGKENDSRPIISYYDADFGLINYFGFYSSDGEINSQIRFDCPAIIKELLCKEETLIRNNDNPPLYPMDNITPSHITVNRNSTGHLTYFKMLIAIQADELMTIKLTDKGEYETSYNLFNIDVGYTDTDLVTYGYQYTRLRVWSEDIKNKRTWETLQSSYTPNIISATKFKMFYIKINDGHNLPLLLKFYCTGDSYIQNLLIKAVVGKLEFGEEGDGRPIIFYYDDRFSSLNYYAFLYTGSEAQAKIRYDCPPTV